MNQPRFLLAGLLPALYCMPLHAQALGEPVLSTPGTASWSTEATGTGFRMIFTITGNTVLDWGQFNLAGGNELVFDFVGGNSVANMLGGTSAHTIGGTVTSNGNVGFFAPDATLRVSGSITAPNVTVATMDVDPHAFNAGEAFTMSSVSGQALTVNGAISATKGSATLAGRTVRIQGAGKIRATEAVRMGGGREVTVLKSGFGRRLKESGGDGFVLHLGEAVAPRIELAAGKEINVNGRLVSGRNKDARIFLEVGQGGTIYREGTALLVGKVDAVGDFDRRGNPINRKVDEVRASLNSSVTTLPALRKPGGAKFSSSRTVVNDAPMTASADGARDRRTDDRKVASNGKPVYKSASFFGFRGDSRKR